MSYMSLPPERKRDFAAAWLRNPNNAYLAGYEVFNDVSKASFAAFEWVKDDEVLQHRSQLINEHGPAGALPTKEEVSKLAYDMAALEDADIKDRLAALTLYAKLQGFIERPPTAVINNSNALEVKTNNVMIVPAHMDNTEWELAVMNQQRKLIEDTENAADRLNSAE